MNLQRFQEMNARFIESGLSIADFCENEGYHKSNFYYWRKQLQKQAEEKACFAPIVIESKSDLLSCHQELQTRDIPHSHQQIPSQTTRDIIAVELKYPNGIELRLKGNIDCSVLKALLTLNAE